MTTLECHSRGDLRFSPFGAEVRVNGRRDNIENHYQGAKLFSTPQGEVQAKDWREARRMKKAGHRQVAWLINGKRLPVTSDPKNPHALSLDDFGVQFYALLWLKYIRANPQLVEYASTFDRFNDPFAGNFPLCQAKVWETAAKAGGGIDQLYLYTAPLRRELAEGETS